MCFGDNVGIDLSDPSRHHVQFHDCHRQSEMRINEYAIAIFDPEHHQADARYR